MAAHQFPRTDQGGLACPGFRASCGDGGRPSDARSRSPTRHRISDCPVAELSDALDFGSSFIAGENPAGAANFNTQCASLRSRASKTQPGWGSTNTACGAIAQAVEQRVRNAKIGARLPVAPPISRPVCEQQNRRSVKPLPSGLHWCKSNPADQTLFIAE